MARSAALRAARLTHLDAQARPTMVDVGGKAVTHRIAEAEARLHLPAAVAAALQRTGHRTQKGPVFDTAIVAGVMAAKRTFELIPFCHPLPLEQCRIEIDLERGRSGAGVVIVRCRAETHHKTGVEMEALTAVTVALLNIWDAVKPYEKDDRGQYPTTRIEDVHVVKKVKKA